jgi:hypothetical protein
MAKGTLSTIDAEEVYNLLFEIDSDAAFKAAMNGDQKSVTVALRAKGFYFDIGVIRALRTIDWTLPLDLLDQDIDFLMPETPAVDWGTSLQFPSNEWGARVDIRLAAGKTVTDLVAWAVTFKASLASRNPNTFTRLFLFTSLTDPTLYALVSVWSSGQDAANFLTDPRIGMSPVITGVPAPQGVFQVAARLANTDVFAMQSLGYCIWQQWTISAGVNGMQLRDNRYKRYETMVAAWNNFEGGIIGWSIQNPTAFVAVTGYVQAADEAPCDSSAPVRQYDAANPVSGIATAGARSTWSARAIN